MLEYIIIIGICISSTITSILLIRWASKNKPDVISGLVLSLGIILALVAFVSIASAIQFFNPVFFPQKTFERKISKLLQGEHGTSAENFLRTEKNSIGNAIYKSDSEIEIAKGLIAEGANTEQKAKLEEFRKQHEAEKKAYLEVLEILEKIRGDKKKDEEPRSP